MYATTPNNNQPMILEMIYSPLTPIVLFANITNGESCTWLINNTVELRAEWILQYLRPLVNNMLSMLLTCTRNCLGFNTTQA